MVKIIMLHVNCIVVISGLNVWYTPIALVIAKSRDSRVLVIFRAIECNISLSSNKMLVIRAGIHKMLVTIANR